MSPSDNQMEYFARCASGFEPVLAQELKSLRLRRVRPLKGGVAFFGSLEDGYRACLWSRVATRVQLVLARVSAGSADALYQGVRDLAWERHVLPKATIAVDAHGENPSLRNTRFTALKVKDALCDRLRDVRGERPDVDASDPDISIDVALHQQRATLYLNLSGPSLHRRGYRQEGVQTQAPLKETLAAGILLAAGWPSIAQAGGVLVDPMCGSGTFAIEAALIAANVAPGLLRTRWGFDGWALHDKRLWERVRQQAEQLRRQQGGRPRIVAGDLDPTAIDIAKANAERAGVARNVDLFVDDAAHLSRHLRGMAKRSSAPGLLVCNPPYGERIGTADDLPQVYAALSAAVQSLPSGWQMALISPDTTIDTALGLVPSEVIACYNGPIKTWVRRYEDVARRQTTSVVSLSGVQASVPVAEANSSQFAARLRKVARERTRWAHKQGIGAFRVYDADLPEYAVSVDLALGSGPSEGERWAVVEERRRPAAVDEQRAARRFADAVALASAVLDVPAGKVLARPWQDERRKGRGTRTQPMRLTVREGTLLFGIDLAGRPDSGLPLALRGVRKLVAGLSEGSRVASLFASTGAALTYAAASGARSTITVDVFDDRLEQARRHLSANHLAGSTHRFVRADAREWLADEARAHHRYDVVVCAPPTWLPSGKQGLGEWELQRDHVTLLQAAADVLAPKGTIVFACLAPRFALDTKALAKAGLAVEDVSARTLPHDFERSAKDYHCFLLRLHDR